MMDDTKSYYKLYIIIIAISENESKNNQSCRIFFEELLLLK